MAGKQQQVLDGIQWERGQDRAPAGNLLYHRSGLPGHRQIELPVGRAAEGIDGGAGDEIAQIRSGLVKPQQRAAAVQDHGPIGGKAEPEHAGIGEILHLPGEIRQGNQGVRYPFGGDGGQIVVGTVLLRVEIQIGFSQHGPDFSLGIDRHLVKGFLRLKRRAEELHGPGGGVHQEQLPAGNQIFVDPISGPQQLPVIRRQLGQAIQRREAAADRRNRIGDFSGSCNLPDGMGDLQPDRVRADARAALPGCLRQRGPGPVLAAGQKRQNQKKYHELLEREFGTHHGPPWLGELEPSKSIYSDPTA